MIYYHSWVYPSCGYGYYYWLNEADRDILWGPAYKRQSRSVVRLENRMIYPEGTFGSFKGLCPFYIESSETIRVVEGTRQASYTCPKYKELSS